MQLLIVYGGQKQLVSVPLDSTILSLKTQLQEKFHRTQPLQLYCKGIPLIDSHTIAESQVTAYDYVVCQVEEEGSGHVYEKQNAVMQLVNMGFEMEIVKSALEMTQNDVSRAIDILMDGEISVPQLETKESMKQLKRLSLNSPVLLQPMIEKMDVTEIQQFVAQPRETMQQILIPDPQVPAETEQPNTEAMERLMALGFSMEQVVEALNACDQNEHYAANLLLQ